MSAASPPKKIAMTLNIKPGMIDEYMTHHNNIPAEVPVALHAVGMRNFTLWNWGDRLFYNAEYVGTVPFEEAMQQYSEMPGVKEWEALMHKYQDRIPGSEGDVVWWQECKMVYEQA